jgi:hypothetical protein
VSITDGALKRWASGEALVEDGAEGVEVRQRADMVDVSAGLLGSHVARRADDGSAPGLPGLIELPGEAEVADLGVEDWLWLRLVS